MKIHSMFSCDVEIIHRFPFRTVFTNEDYETQFLNNYRLSSASENKKFYIFLLSLSFLLFLVTHIKFCFENQVFANPQNYRISTWIKFFISIFLITSANYFIRSTVLKKTSKWDLIILVYAFIFLILEFSIKLYQLQKSPYSGINICL
jgi:hypothetical protein